MNEFVAGVERTIRRRGLLKGSERVVVAVSGGPDSLALLYALHELSSSWSLDLHVAHFDHRWRDDSGDDAAFVSRVARRLQLPATLGGAPEENEVSGRSPEDAAREWRLAFLEGVAAAAGADRIATGHTLDDQAETVMMRLLSGAGARGLSGIPPKRDLYVRPLIDSRRSDVEAFCRAMRLRPRRDETNESTLLLRNAIRLEALPFLSSRFNTSLSEALARTADLLREEDELLDVLAAEAIDIENTPSGVRIALDALLSQPLALQRRIVRRAFVGYAPSAAHIDRVLELAATGASGDAVDLPQRLNARLEYGSLHIGRAASPAPEPQPVRLEVPGTTEVPWLDAMVTIWEEERAPSVLPDGKTSCVLDGDVLGSALVVRPPRRGDRFVPLGMRGTKTVADMLSEAHVPRERRPLVPVVASRNDIVWVVGHRLGDRCKVTAKTRRFVGLAFEGGRAWRS